LLAKPVAEAAAGDVLLFRMRNGAVAKHLELQGRAGTDPSFIHAYSGKGWSKARCVPHGRAVLWHGFHFLKETVLL